MRKVYFQGWGSALTEDHAGDHEALGEDGYTMYEKEEGCDVFQGELCDEQEFCSFVAATYLGTAN